MNRRTLKKQLNKVKQEIIAFNKGKRNIKSKKNPMLKYAVREEQERLIGLTRSYTNDINIKEILQMSKQEQQQRLKEIKAIGDLKTLKNEQLLINKYTDINKAIYEKSSMYLDGAVDFKTFNKFLYLGGKDMLKENNTNAYSKKVLLYLKQYIENGNSISNSIENFKRYVRDQEIIIEKSKARSSMIFRNL